MQLQLSAFPAAAATTAAAVAAAAAAATAATAGKRYTHCRDSWKVDHLALLGVHVVGVFVGA